MKKLTTLLLALLLLVGSAAAQDKRSPHFNPEEFKAKMEKFISSKAELTASESETLLPLFEKMKEEQRELANKERKLRKKAREANSEKEFQETVEAISRLHIQTAKIEETYYKKMGEAVSFRKAYALMMADKAFHREVLQQIGNPKGDKKHHPGPRP